MQALTLHAPWAWAIIYGGKDIENRVWQPPQHILGERIAIHAGKNMGDPDAPVFIARLCPDSPSKYERGVILGTALLVGAVGDDDDGLVWIGDLSEQEARAAFYSPWFGGPVGWLLRDAKALPKPVPCKGMLGLWQVKVDLCEGTVRSLSPGR